MSMKVLDEFCKLLVHRREMPFIDYGIYRVRFDMCVFCVILSYNI